MTSITLRSGPHLQQIVRAGPHTVIVDEPIEAGGDNAGPDPYSYLLSALAGCTAISLFLYAQRKEWPLEEVEITLSISREYSADCDHCEEKVDAFIDEIERHIMLRGPLNEEQKERLAYIATVCPIHKTLTTVTHIHDTVSQA